MASIALFAPNLIQTPKTGSHSQIYRQTLHSAKIQDGGGGRLEIS